MLRMERSYLIKWGVIGIVVVLAAHHAYSSSSQAQPASTNPIMAVATKMPTEAQPTVQQQLTANLQKSGFTDVRIVPDSLLIQAKDQSGNPVTIFSRKE